MYVTIGPQLSTMSLQHIRDELTRLQEHVAAVKERFDKDTTRIQYYLLEASDHEEEFWIAEFKALRDRADLILHSWESEVMLLRAFTEMTPEEQAI